MYDITHATPELFAALSKAQGEIENASKNAANPHFKSKYADLAEVLNTIRPPFAANGLSLIQSPGFDGAMVSVTTLLAHSSGGYITSTASCVPAKSDAQGIGSSTTYLRRYGAAAVAGIAQEDDDGQEAAHATEPAAISDIQQAKADDFKASIAGAVDEIELGKVGAQLAKSALPPALLTNLRAIYSARNADFKKGAQQEKAA